MDLAIDAEDMGMVVLDLVMGVYLPQICLTLHPYWWLLHELNSHVTHLLSSKSNFHDCAEPDDKLGCSTCTMARIFYSGLPVKLGEDIVELYKHVV